MAVEKQQLLQKQMQNKQMQAQKEQQRITLKSQITQTHLNKRYYPYAISSTGVFHENKADERVNLDQALQEVQVIMNFINSTGPKAKENEPVDMAEIKKLAK